MFPCTVITFFSPFFFTVITFFSPLEGLQVETDEGSVCYCEREREIVRERKRKGEREEIQAQDITVCGFHLLLVGVVRFPFFFLKFHTSFYR